MKYFVLCMIALAAAAIWPRGPARAGKTGGADGEFTACVIASRAQLEGELSGLESEFETLRGSWGFAGQVARRLGCTRLIEEELAKRLPALRGAIPSLKFPLGLEDCKQVVAMQDRSRAWLRSYREARFSGWMDKSPGVCRGESLKVEFRHYCQASAAPPISAAQEDQLADAEKATEAFRGPSLAEEEPKPDESPAASMKPASEGKRGIQWRTGKSYREEGARALAAIDQKGDYSAWDKFPLGEALIQAELEEDKSLSKGEREMYRLLWESKLEEYRALLEEALGGDEEKYQLLSEWVHADFTKRYAGAKTGIRAFFAGEGANCQGNTKLFLSFSHALGLRPPAPQSEGVQAFGNHVQAAVYHPERHAVWVVQSGERRLGVLSEIYHPAWILNEHIKRRMPEAAIDETKLLLKSADRPPTAEEIAALAREALEDAKKGRDPGELRANSMHYFDGTAPDQATAPPVKRMTWDEATKTPEVSTGRKLKEKEVASSVRDDRPRQSSSVPVPSVAVSSGPAGVPYSRHSEQGSPAYFGELEIIPPHGRRLERVAEGEPNSVTVHGSRLLSSSLVNPRPYWIESWDRRAGGVDGISFESEEVARAFHATPASLKGEFLKKLVWERVGESSRKAIPLLKRYLDGPGRLDAGELEELRLRNDEFRALLDAEDILGSLDQRAREKVVEEVPDAKEHLRLLARLVLTRRSLDGRLLLRATQEDGVRAIRESALDAQSGSALRALTKQLPRLKEIFPASDRKRIEEAVADPVQYPELLTKLGSSREVTLRTGSQAKRADPLARTDSLKERLAEARDRLKAIQDRAQARVRTATRGLGHPRVLSALSAVPRPREALQRLSAELSARLGPQDAKIKLTPLEFATALARLGEYDNMGGRPATEDVSRDLRNKTWLETSVSQAFSRRWTPQASQELIQALNADRGSWQPAVSRFTTMLVEAYAKQAYAQTSTQERPLSSPPGWIVIHVEASNGLLEGQDDFTVPRKVAALFYHVHCVGSPAPTWTGSGASCGKLKVALGNVDDMGD